ncbi:MAG TPA: polysaccharide biosynthesis C-terminal domain-containing protein [Saprospiraceae bacterium]|nr:polysaccharide biosynthesis C-terminal domain-containing protein [Saprospiraceae bacterium]
MKREFTINIILLVIINLLIKPAYIFGVDARIQNLVGIESYGMYFDYFNFVFLFQFLNDPGLQNWNAQHVPKNRDQVGTNLRNLLSIKLIFGLLFTSITLISSFFVGYDNQMMMLFLCLNMILSTLFIFLRGTIAGLGHYRIDSFLSVLDKALMIVILGYLAWISSYQTRFEITALIYGQGLAYLIACMVAGVFLYKNVSWKSNVFTFKYLLDVLKWSAPYVLILIFMTSYNRLDGVMLGRMIDDNSYQAGVYATAYRFYDAANMIGYLFAALLLPMFAANMNDHKTLHILKEIGLRFVVLSAAMIVLSIVFYGENMLALLFDEFTPEFVVVLRLLILSYFMVAVAYIYGTMLVACGKVRYLNYLFGIGLLLNILLNLFLIPNYMAVGAAVATLITQTFMLAGQIFLVKKEIKIGTSINEILKIFAFGAISTVLFYVLNISLALHWTVVLSISILICLLLSFILKIVDKQEIFQLLKREK